MDRMYFQCAVDYPEYGIEVGDWVCFQPHVEDFPVIKLTFLQGDRLVERMRKMWILAEHAGRGFRVDGIPTEPGRPNLQLVK